MGDDWKRIPMRRRTLHRGTGLRYGSLFIPWFSGCIRPTGKRITGKRRTGQP